MSKPMNLALRITHRLEALKHSMGFQDGILNGCLDELIDELREPVPPKPALKSFGAVVHESIAYLNSFVRILSGRINRVVKEFNEWRDKLSSQLDRLLKLANANIEFIGTVQEQVFKLNSRVDQLALDQKTMADMQGNDHTAGAVFSRNMTDVIEELRRRLYVLTDEQFKIFEKSIEELDCKQAAGEKGIRLILAAHIRRIERLEKYLMGGNWSDFAAGVKEAKNETDKS